MRMHFIKKGIEVAERLAVRKTHERAKKAVLDKAKERRGKKMSKRTKFRVDRGYAAWSHEEPSKGDPQLGEKLAIAYNIIPKDWIQWTTEPKFWEIIAQIYYYFKRSGGISSKKILLLRKKKYYTWAGMTTTPALVRKI